jgi:hypothetical protein
MPSTDALAEQLRSVDERATKAAAQSSSEFGFAEARRSAEEVIGLMIEKYEGVGARIDALSATGTPGDIAIRQEVTMSQAAAEKLFGAPNTRARIAAVVHSQRIGFSSMRVKSRDDREQLVRHFRARQVQPTLPDWMQAVRKLDENGQSDAALDEMFDHIDSMLSSQEFSDVDAILGAMPVEGPSLTLMMGLLSITRPAAQHLPSRRQYFDRVFRLCNAMRRDADSLLGGLR